MDAQKIRNAVVEISNSMTRSESERELVREIIKKIHDEEGIDRRLLRRIARAYHKGNFSEETTLNSEFEDLFNNLMS